MDHSDEGGDGAEAEGSMNEQLDLVVVCRRKDGLCELVEDLKGKHASEERRGSIDLGASFVPLQRRERQWIEWVPVIKNDIENFSTVLGLLVDAKAKNFLENKFIKDLSNWIGKDVSLFDLYFWDLEVPCRG